MSNSSPSPISSHPPLIVLLGPTAVGKTDLSLSLCAQFSGEVVSADSRQVYRQMDIGTAKPTLAERAVVPHHLFDIRDPDETLSLAEYQRLGYGTIDAVHAAGSVPFWWVGRCCTCARSSKGCAFQKYRQTLHCAPS